MAGHAKTGREKVILLAAVITLARVCNGARDQQPSCAGELGEPKRLAGEPGAGKATMTVIWWPVFCFYYLSFAAY